MPINQDTANTLNALAATTFDERHHGARERRPVLAR